MHSRVYHDKNGSQSISPIWFDDNGDRDEHGVSSYKFGHSAGLLGELGVGLGQ